MRRLFCAGVFLCAASTGLWADSITYFLSNAYYFPSGPVTNSMSGSLTALVSNPTVFSTNPGNPSADVYNGLGSIGVSPWVLSVNNSTTINTTTMAIGSGGILSITAATTFDNSMTITGGTGTGYILPTFEYKGTVNNTNPNVTANLITCVGNSGCDLPTIGSWGLGSQTIDIFYTPPIDSFSAFTFGTPFNLVMGFQSDPEISGTQANPSGTSIGDFTMQLVSVRIANADGAMIPGQINSQLLAPEPGTMGLACAALGALALWRIRARVF